MPSAAFRAAAAVVLDMERGFQADPADRGNWTGGAVGVGENSGTNFGISAAQYPTLDIKGLTRDAALAIYERDYWQPIKGDLLPYPIALALFDTRVNGGKPVVWLQQSLGLPADGVFGSATLAAAQAAQDPVAVAGRILRRRVLYLAALKTFDTFGPGWVQRCFDVYRAAIAGAPGAVA